MDEKHKTYLRRIGEFIPKDRIYTDDPQTLKEIKRKRAGGLAPDS